MNKQILCPTCRYDVFFFASEHSHSCLRNRGSGAKDSNDVHTCSSCQGRGVKIVRQQLAPGMYQQMQMQYVFCDIIFIECILINELLA